MFDRGHRADRPLFVTGLGSDSIDALELAIAIEKRYGVRFAADDAQNERIFASLRSLAQHIERALSQRRRSPSRERRDARIAARATQSMQGKKTRLLFQAAALVFALAYPLIVYFGLTRGSTRFAAWLLLALSFGHTLLRSFQLRRLALAERAGRPAVRSSDVAGRPPLHAGPAGPDQRRPVQPVFRLAAQLDAAGRALCAHAGQRPVRGGAQLLPRASRSCGPRFLCSTALQRRSWRRAPRWTYGRSTPA